MDTTVITIPVDAETARAYQAAPAEIQQKVQLLLRLQLRDLMGEPQRSLSEIMDDIGNEAEARGLTPERLEELLRDDE